VLSERPRPLSAYFRQRFAQVTNPPIDSLREKKVMALDTFLGPRTNVLIEDPAAAELVHLPSLVIGEAQLQSLISLNRGRLRGRRLSTLFEAPAHESDAAASDSPLRSALDRILGEAEAAVRDGISVLVLSDRGVDETHAAVPMLLAVGAIHHDLIRKGLRMEVDLVCETGEVWDVHHLACLVGFGAAAVHPYLALRAVSELVGTRGFDDKSAEDLQRNYVHALEHGMLKVSSKMGISTVSGYKAAQIFEAIGISEELIDRCFAGTPSRLGGIGLAEIESDVLRRHREAFTEPVVKLPDPGFVRFRKDGEPHAFNRRWRRRSKPRRRATIRSTSRRTAIWSRDTR
jgi:hypothetical protein